MKLGFVSAILPDLTIEEVIAFAAQAGYACVELMCWPVGKSDRRYAGVTHIDCAGLGDGEVERTHDVLAASGIEISGLGYYPNPLTPYRAEAEFYIAHIRKVIAAARMLGVPAW